MTEHPRRLVPVTCSTVTGAPDGIHLSVAEWNDLWQEYLTGFALCGQSANQGELPVDTAITCPACEALRDTYERALARRPTAAEEQLAALQARVADLEAELHRLQSADPHHYLATGCLHGDMVLPDGRTGHQYCQGETGAVGAKKPAVCKFCAAPCQCVCHRPAEVASPTVTT